jgi:hypothetical protein
MVSLTAISTVDCVRKCVENKECLSLYYKENCRMYSGAADKHCTGFVAETVSVSSGYYEVQRVSLQYDCICETAYSPYTVTMVSLASWADVFWKPGEMG